MTALARAIARPTPVAGFGARSPLHGLERRSIGILDLAAQSVAAVAPAAAATTVVLMVAGVAPGNTVAAIVVAALLSFGVARTVSQFARRFAAAGALYTYTARGLGTRAGLGAGAAIVVGYAAIAMFSLLGCAYYLAYLLGGLWPTVPSGAAVTIALVVEALAVAAVLVAGIRLSARVALVVEAASVVLIVVLLGTLLFFIGPVDVAASLAPGPFDPVALAAGAVVAVTAFVGFESAATLGVESVAPLRNVPRAITGTVLISGGVYVLAAVTQVSGFHALGRDLAASASPVNDLAGTFGLGPWGVVADVGIAASFLACAIGSMTALVRVLFAMSRDGVLPARIGRTHPRLRTPVAATLTALPIVAGVPLLLSVAGVDPREAMQVTLAVGATGYICAYVLVCVAAPVFLRRIGEFTIASAVTAGVSAVALVAALVAFLVVGSDRIGAVCVAVIAVAAVGFVVVAGRRLGSRSLGAYDEPVAAQVLGGVAPPGRGGR
ncbi:MAG: APC family permease [Microbacterium sp.]|uniref:APC family permease n=1 Tax=Microbacterium sp. TaxID=51671 RepID=UPI0025ED92F5|nr:APC family permease [Microbacterium sp.]MBQ9919048.1 APC family permease [Microbacterium sp.]